MAGSVNKVILIGNLGADPDIRSFQSGDKVANLSIATSERWKDKQTGERKERTEWHRVVLKNQGLVKVAEQYLRKGAKVYIEGQLETRSWEANGEKKYTTEVVLRPYRGELVMLDSRGSSSGQHDDGNYNQDGGAGYYDKSRQALPQSEAGYPQPEEYEDEIPF